MKAIEERVQAAWLAIKDASIELRHALHQKPELGYKEVETTRRIHKFLQNYNVSCETFEGQTGLVAFIDNGMEITVGLRVDIDALPLQEKTDSDFSSQNTGVMHACGHDMHAAIGAAMAVVLSALRHSLPVNVKILFQPAEECSPRGGAMDMKKLGILDNPKVSSLFGFHVWPEYALGHMGVRSGPMMASSDKFKITIGGVAAHAAQPHKGVDAILIASEMINAIYKVLPRTLNLFTPHVLTIGEISSKGRYNIVSDHVEMMGTLRTLDSASRKAVREWLTATVESLPKLYGAQGLLDFDQGYDVVVNDDALTGVFTQHAREVLGGDCVHTLNPPSLIAEDFSALSADIPSVYFHLGCGGQHPLHSDQFLASDEALDVGIRLLSTFFLSENFKAFLQKS